MTVGLKEEARVLPRQIRSGRCVHGQNVYVKEEGWGAQDDRRERTDVSGEKDQRGPVRMEWCEVGGRGGQASSSCLPHSNGKWRVSSEESRQGHPRTGQGAAGQRPWRENNQQSSAE